MIRYVCCSNVSTFVICHRLYISVALSVLTLILKFLDIARTYVIKISHSLLFSGFEVKFNVKKNHEK